MTLQLGMVRPGSTLYIPFASYAGATGASVTLTGLAVTDIEIYSNGSVTQRASDTGYTLLDTDGIDFDGITGIHGFSIDLSSNATAGFFVAGASYWVVVSAVTIDSQTVNFIAATFTIGYPDALINTTIATLASQTSFTLTAGPAEDDALNGCRVVIHDIASAVQLGTALIADYTGSTRTVTLAAGTTFTAAAGDNISIFTPALLPTVAGRTLDVSSGGEAGIDWANVGTPGSTVSLSATTVATTTSVTNQVTANVTQISGDTTAADNAEAFFDGTGYAGTNNVIPTVTNVTNQVTANVTALSGDTTAADNAEAFFDGTGYAGTNNVIPTVTTVNGLAANVITATALATTAVDEIVDAVWDEVLTAATHNVAASAGRRLRELGTTVIRTGTAQAGATNSITLDTGASTTSEIYDENLITILSGTGAGQTRAITDYDGSTRVAVVNRNWDVTPDNTSEFQITGFALPTISEHGLAQAGSASTITLASTASTTDDVYNGSLIYLSTSTGAGQARLITDYVGSTRVATVEPAWSVTPGSGSVYKVIPFGATPWNAAWDAEVQSEVADALAVYDPPTNAEMEARTLVAANYATAAGVSAVETDTQDIQARLPAALVSGRIDASVGAMAANTLTASALATDAVDEIVDAVWDEVLTAATHNIANSAGRRLRQVRSALYTGTAQAGASLSITLDTGASTTNDIYNGEIISIVSGTGAGQTRSIVNYVGSTRVATIEREWTTNPDNTSVFEIVGADNLLIVEENVAQAGGASTITLASDAIATDDIYTGSSLVVSGGTGRGQTRIITDYVGSTRVATVAPAWAVQPDSTSVYQILPVGQVIVQSLAGTVQADLVDAVWDEAISGHLSAGSTGAALNGATAPTAAAVADAVWDEALSGHLSAGSTGEALNAAGGAGDPWITTLPGSYTAGQAGYILGTNLDAAVSTRATPAQVNAEVDTALADVNLDHLVGTATGIPAIPSGTYLDQIMDDGTAVYDRTTDSLQAIRDRGDAAWDTADVSGLATAANLATLQTTANDILADTGTDLPATLATIDNLVDDLETRLTATRAGYLDNLSGGAVALQSSVDSLESGVTLTNAGIDAIFDRTDGVETGYTLRQALRLIAAAVAGELSGAATTTITIRNLSDTTTRITATVDADGNRSAVVHNVS
jgi:hypothetical protein